MRDPNSFNARAAFRIEPDRYYRVELYNGCLYFLRVGGQFDLDRAGSAPTNAGLLGVMLMAGASIALNHKYQKAQLIARDPQKRPEELLTIHPHNFMLRPADIRRAKFLPQKKWFPSHGRNVGRLVIETWDGKSQEYWFQESEDLNKAVQHLSALLGDRLESRAP
jgi:hypothetical protein